MFCHKCGTKAIEGSEFCLKCGAAPVAGDEDVHAQAKQDAANSASQEGTPGQQNSGVLYKFVTLVVLVVALVIFAMCSNSIGNGGGSTGDGAQSTSNQKGETYVTGTDG